MENIFYFKNINAIGGTEQFLYEIAKKCHDIDITFFYDTIDQKQLRRLRQLCRCKRRIPGQTVKCRFAFYNFNIDMIDDVEAERHYFVSHAIYQELGYKPPIDHPKLTHFIGVSKYSKDKLEEYGRIIGREIKAEVCYNPLTLEKPDKVIRLISATRLDDKTKGGQRTQQLIKALDDYCLRNNRQYLWTVFTNQVQMRIESPNVCIMQPRIDIRPYIADSDYLVQLSNDMETYCYSINEALGYGVPVVATPLEVLKELPVKPEMYIECAWDMNNVWDVARQIFEKKEKKFSYVPPSDRWREILSNVPSDYTVADSTIKVRATAAWKRNNLLDKETMIIPDPGSEWLIDEQRYDELIAYEEKEKVHLIDKL